MAIGVCDRVLMLQYGVYSVIHRGCASIFVAQRGQKELAASHDAHGVVS